MQLTGHKTRAIFDRYDIVSEADLRDAVSRLAGQGQFRDSQPRRGQVVNVASRRK
jgi:hypothetical protein